MACGSVVDEADLGAAWASGQIAAVGLDVLRDEPPDTEEPLLGFPQAPIPFATVVTTLEPAFRP